MKHKSPKQLRIDKKKPKFLQPGIQITTTEIISIPRIVNLPPYDEYNPNRIHIARRRKAWKDHKTFPRGWTFGPVVIND